MGRSRACPPRPLAALSARVVARGLPTIALEDLLYLIDAALGRLRRRGLPSHIEEDDLATVGLIALTKAYRRANGSDPEVRAFCFQRIHGAMLDELRRYDHVSRRSRDVLDRIQREQEVLEQQLGHAPTVDQVAAAVGLPEKKVRRLLDMDESCRRTLDSEAQLRLLTSDAPAPDTEFLDWERRTELSSAISQLPQRELYVLRRLFYDGARVESVAHELQLSKPSIYQIRDRALARLREALPRRDEISAQTHTGPTGSLRALPQ